MTNLLTESTVEEATLNWFEELGYTVLHGPTIAPGERDAERDSYREVVLMGRLQAAVERLNRSIPAPAIEDAVRKVTRLDSPNLVENNRRFHDYLVNGVDVEYQRSDGTITGDRVWLVDFAAPQANDWLVVNQFTVEEMQNRRPDVVVFVNGLPLAVIELKNPKDAHATIQGAYNQLQTYKKDIPGLFPYNAVLVVSDGTEARVGTLTAGWEWFMSWKTITGDDLAPKGQAQLEVLLKGIFAPSRFLDLLRSFIVFASDGATISKKIAAYHQFHAVNKAVDRTLQATGGDGDKRAGVVWHTQGSGKSLSMAFYAGKVIAHPRMTNPTIIVLTDRDDLDDQLFGTFADCQALLRQTPVQAEDRKHLREVLQVASGGVVFTTIQKFFPEPGEAYPCLSDRRNIVFIADEAHRSQYGFSAHLVKSKGGSEGHIAYGYAKYIRDGLPNASFIAFTGTPIDLTDKSTRAVFGDYIDTYDIRRAVEDKATVPIYYEARLAKLALDEAERPRIEGDFENVTEGEEESAKEKLKSKWARMEAMVGATKRLDLVAKDIVEHFERREEALTGKGMIVGMSRRICVELYAAITALRPAWHTDDDATGTLKVVMTGSAADPETFYPHVRNKARREALAARFKDPADPFKLVIVRDMWLTGFDAPSLHTMYLDKPMRGHGLMQAIARVNRVFKDKEGGLIVDYLGLGADLKEALKNYTQADQGETGIPQGQAVAIMLERLEVVRAMVHGFDYRRFFDGTPAERVNVIPAAMEFILERDAKDGKRRLLDAVTALSRTFALAVPSDEALAVRDEVGFFQAIRAAFTKITGEGGKDQDELDSAVRQIVSRAITSPEILDIFAVAGLERPDASILSDEFLEEVRGLPYKNVALEALRRLLSDEIKSRARRNVTQTRSFADKLEEAILRYQNRALTAAQVIAALIEIAKEVRAAAKRGETLGLSDDELAFYDALGVNDSAVQVLGDDTLRQIARDLVATVRANATIDWTVKETVRAKLRVMVRRLLSRYGYPPDKQATAIQTILEQAEALGQEWAA